MRKTVFAFLTACLLLVPSCTPSLEKNVMCTVLLRVSLPGGEDVVTLDVDPSLSGNMFFNMNTGINYPYPRFQNNSCVMEVQKGVYQISFEGVATLPDGSSRNVRFTKWADPVNAVNLLQDTEMLEIELKVIK